MAGYPSEEAMPMKRLEYVRGITQEEADRLRRLGVRHTNALLHATTLVIDREQLSAQSGISEERLRALGDQAALMEVSGAERFIHVLTRLGITSLRSLAEQHPAKLHERLVGILGLGGAPLPADVEYWISQARLIDVVEDPDESQLRQDRLRQWRSR
jgi:predicted RecB family nuclease